MAPAATATVKAVKREVPFAWEGRDKRGARIKGRSLAPDEQTLRAELRRQGVAPSKIRKQRQGRKGGKVNPGDIAVFSSPPCSRPAFHSCRHSRSSARGMRSPRCRSSFSISRLTSREAPPYTK